MVKPVKRTLRLPKISEKRKNILLRVARNRLMSSSEKPLPKLNPKVATLKLRTLRTLLANSGLPKEEIVKITGTEVLPMEETIKIAQKVNPLQVDKILSLHMDLQHLRNIENLCQGILSLKKLQ